MSHLQENQVIESYENENEDENNSDINEENSLIPGIPNIITYFTIGVGAIITFFALASYI